MLETDSWNWWASARPWLQVCKQHSILFAGIEGMGLVLQSEYWDAYSDDRVKTSHLSFAGRGSKKSELMVLVSPVPCTRIPSSPVLLKYLDDLCEGNQVMVFYMYSWTTQLHTCAKAAALTLGQGKAGLLLVSGWFGASWEDRYAKQKQDFWVLLLFLFCSPQFIK